jgi:hypothetical protein
MNDLHFASRVKQHLNRSLVEIDNDTLARLRTAREAALAVQKKPAAAPLLATAGHALRFQLEGRGVRFSLAALALAFAAALFVHWQSDRTLAELSEFDSTLLSDIVPVEALVDKGFEEWLQKPRQD